jgi:hypothetical protein
LQCSICSNYSHHEQFFLQDNFTYIGTCPCSASAQREGRFVGHGHGSIFRDSLTWDTQHSQGAFPFPKTTLVTKSSGVEQLLPTLKRSFQLRLQKVHDQGQNAIFIFEGCHKFDSAHVAALVQFLQPLFHIRIIVTYRRLYEWLPSKYNSIHKSSDRRKNQDISNWPGHMHVLRNGKPGKSVELQPFHLNFDAESNNVDDDNEMEDDDFDQLVHDIVATQQHPAQIIRDNYAMYFDHVHVIPLHALPDSAFLPDHVNAGVTTTTTDNNETKASATTISPYLYHLFCTILVETTPHICRALQQGEFQQRSPHENHSVSLDYDRIAVAAHERGWIPSNALRGQIAQRVQKYVYSQNMQHQGMQQEAETDDIETLPKPTTLSPPYQQQMAFPKECLPNATLNRLLNLSMTMEENLFGHEMTMHWQEDHRRAFERYRQRYCWLDTNKLLDRSEEWKSFLQNLGEQYGP